MLSVFQDLAPGLTTCMGARRNWHIFSDGDFQSTSLTDAPIALRALLKQKYQIVAASGKQLSQSYIYAQQAEPLASLFDSGAEA